MSESVLYFLGISVYGLVVIHLQDYSALIYNSVFALSILNLNLFILIVAHPKRTEPLLLSVPGAVLIGCTLIKEDGVPITLQIFYFPNMLVYAALILIIVMEMVKKCYNLPVDSPVEEVQVIAPLEQAVEGVVIAVVDERSQPLLSHPEGEVV
jgi:hypothetical protein